MTIIVKSDKDGLKIAVEFLRKGKVIVYPTETAYGIGCDLTNVDAIKKIYKIKKRNVKKKMSVIVSDVTMAEKFGNLKKVDRILINEFMPGPLTLIVPKRKNFPDIANVEFVFRISSNKIAKNLSKKLGRPIVASSANYSGEKTNYKIKEVIKDFNNKVDLIIDEGNLKKKEVSTIAKFDENKKIKILREGPISKEEIEEVLKNAS